MVAAACVRRKEVSIHDACSKEAIMPEIGHVLGLIKESGFMSISVRQASRLPRIGAWPKRWVGTSARGDSIGQIS